MPDEAARIAIMNAIPATAVLKGERAGKFCGSLMSEDNHEKRRALLDSSRAARIYVQGTCFACALAHLVNPRTGKVLGAEDE